MNYNTYISQYTNNNQETTSITKKQRETYINYGTLFTKLIIATIVIVSFYTIIQRKNTSNDNITYNSFVEKIIDDNTYSIEIRVESPTYGVISTLDYLPWDGIVEPHKNQIVSVSSFNLLNQETDLSTYNVIWNINNDIYSGSEINIMMNDTGVFDCNVAIVSLNTFNRKLTNVYTYDFKLAVKYIRREIRSLTDEDREDYFNALDLIYQLDETTGQSIYGSKYHSAEYFSYKHLTGAGTTDCDHWHDGAGIITHHMAFSLEFEQTLQSINPSLASHYWEYGMDTYLYDTWSQSPVFDPDWFGMSSPTNTEHKIDDDGRWDGVKVPDGTQYKDWSISKTGTLNPYVNAYGHMRSPWNNNPFQEIARHNMTYSMTQYETMPTCSTLQSCFKSSSLADINECSNGATHGPVHILIGGAWGDGNLFDDEDVIMVQRPEKLLYFKILWRMGFTRCPDSCELGSVCKCSVPKQYIDEYGAEYILKATNIYYGLSNYLEDADDELLEKVLRAVEDSGIVGDMFSSAAAIDPIFWPLHGQIERLLGAKRILISKGEITDFNETWAFKEYDKYGGGAYLNGVCDWSNVKGSGDLTLPTCILNKICDGHNADDILEFSGFISDNDEYTNQEFYDFIHPWTEELPYTYDSWNFDYCAEQGYSFTSDDTQTNMIPGIPDNSLPGIVPGIPNGDMSNGLIPPNK